MTATGRLPPALRRPVLPRQRAAWALVAAVMAAHTWLLDRWPGAPGPGEQVQPPGAMRVRSIAAPSTSMTASTTASEAVAGAPAADPDPAPGAASPRARAAPSSAPEPVTTAAVAPPDAPPALAPQPAHPAANVRAGASTAPSEPESDAEAVPAPGGQALPIYPTRHPPPLSLQYVWRRGAAEGTALLDWRPDAGGYRLTLQGQAPGVAPLGWSSQGRFDEAGIAPQRYVEQRRGREARAANFQRDRGRISFSGPAIEHPLLPGTQDRLSWLLQLAGVLSADAALGTPGRTVSLWVVGTRGDAAVWTFTVQGRPALDALPMGPLADTVHLLREPGGPYDTQVQVWLDPQRHHLPVQVQWRVRATGEGQSLALQAGTP